MVFLNTIWLASFKVTISVKSQRMDSAYVVLTLEFSVMTVLKVYVQYVLYFTSEVIFVI